MSERFVTIRHVGDPTEAEMLKDLLEQEGIAATIQGNTHSAMLGGLGAAALRVPLQVRERDAARAREVLDALEEFDSVEAPDTPMVPDQLDMKEGAGPYRGAAVTEETMPRRKKTVAIAASLLLPFVIGIFGGGHFYVRSYLPGLVLLMSAWTAIVLGFNGRIWAFYALPLVIVVDAAGAVYAIAKREKR